MSIQLRRLISSRINELTPVKYSVPSFLKLKQNKLGQIELRWPVKSAEFNIPTTIFNDDDKIQSVIRDEAGISFILNKSKVVEEVFNHPTNIRITDEPKKLIFEFSSPNIAKPFHMGHLRSTIIGNFLANLFKKTNHNVLKMNYLGDYGTQFGFLKVGIEMEKLTESQIKSNPLTSLFKAYVTANNSTDPAIADKARSIFEAMENSEDGEAIAQWEQIKKYTMDELNSMYNRLNVVFDVYESESMYRRKAIENVISQLTEKNLLMKDDLGRQIVMVDDQKVPIIKSDGTTLYLTRDIAAFLKREKIYEMEKIFYVVDNGQANHFIALRSIMKDLGHNINVINHVKFGRIKGMSTRKGSVVFLKEILDEAKDLMFIKQKETATTKVDLSRCGESVADVLGSSAVIVNDLKQRRLRDYEFDWDKILQVNGDTGVKLQYTHCRLNSLKIQCGVTEADKVNLEMLPEPEAQKLILEILRYPESILNCIENLEACELVNYLFSLCNATSKALKTLNVKNASPQVASQRLLLFNTSKRVLKHGLEILGLKVLDEM